MLGQAESRGYPPEAIWRARSLFYWDDKTRAISMEPANSGASPTPGRQATPDTLGKRRNAKCNPCNAGCLSAGGGRRAPRQYRPTLAADSDGGEATR